MVTKIIKNFKLKKLYIKSYIFKQLLKSFINNPKISLEERQYLKNKFLIKYNYKYSITRLRNHCLITYETHSIYKCLKLSRHALKRKVLNGQLPG
jgi:ribosomal protein S14